MWYLPGERNICKNIYHLSSPMWSSVKTQLWLFIRFISVIESSFLITIIIYNLIFLVLFQDMTKLRFKIHSLLNMNQIKLNQFSVNSEVSSPNPSDDFFFSVLPIISSLFPFLPLHLFYISGGQDWCTGRRKVLMFIKISNNPQLDYFRMIWQISGLGGETPWCREGELKYCGFEMPWLGQALT